VTKKTKVIRMKPFTAEEDWYRTYHLDIKDILNKLDSSEELAEELLGWSTWKNINAPNVLRNQTSNVWKTRRVKKKELQRSTYLWRGGYVPRSSGLPIEWNKHWNQQSFEFDKECGNCINKNKYNSCRESHQLNPSRAPKKPQNKNQESSTTSPETIG
jgi:hypothetical protein